MSVNFEEYIQRIKSEEDIFSKARLLEFLVKEKRYKIKDVAEYLGLSSSYVCNLLRILKLPELIRDGYYARIISPTHLFVISRLQTYEQMVEAYEKVLAENLSTTELEAHVREVLYGISTSGRHVSAKKRKDVQKAFESLDDRIKAKIIQTRVKAKVILTIDGSLEDTSDALETLGRILTEADTDSE